MQLSLHIPGLLWPEPVLSDSVAGLQLPALQTLLGQGALRRLTQSQEQAYLAALFGREAPPAGPLRCLAGGQAPGEAHWACVDPAHVRVEQQGLFLDDPRRLSLTESERLALEAALAPLWDGFGHLQCGPAGWVLALDREATGLPERLAPLVGQPARDCLPAGEAGKPWRRLMNEIQMTLHQHPVNQARQSLGLPAISSLVIWGAGQLPSQAADGLAPIRQGLHFAAADHHPELLGWARMAGFASAPLATDLTLTLAALPASSDTPPPALHAYLDLLSGPTAERNALAWREGLTTLEADWLAPALAALHRGQLKRLTLHAQGGVGEPSLLTVEYRPAHRYCFWRRPAPLNTLHP